MLVLGLGLGLGLALGSGLGLGSGQGLGLGLWLGLGHLADVHAQPAELVADVHLLLDVERRACRATVRQADSLDPQADTG